MIERKGEMRWTDTSWMAVPHKRESQEVEQERAHGIERGRNSVRN
jgi:hypothetical protein